MKFQCIDQWGELPAKTRGRRFCLSSLFPSPSVLRVCVCAVYVRGQTRRCCLSPLAAASQLPPFFFLFWSNHFAGFIYHCHTLPPSPLSPLKITTIKHRQLATKHFINSVGVPPQRVLLRLDTSNPYNLPFLLKSTHCDGLTLWQQRWTTSILTRSTRFGRRYKNNLSLSCFVLKAHTILISRWFE